MPEEARRKLGWGFQLSPWLLSWAGGPVQPPLLPERHWLLHLSLSHSPDPSVTLPKHCLPPENASCVPGRAPQWERGPGGSWVLASALRWVVGWGHRVQGRCLSQAQSSLTELTAPSLWLCAPVGALGFLYPSQDPQELLGLQVVILGRQRQPALPASVAGAGREPEGTVTALPGMGTGPGWRAQQAGPAALLAARPVPPCPWLEPDVAAPCGSGQQREQPLELPDKAQSRHRALACSCLLRASAQTPRGQAGMCSCSPAPRVPRAAGSQLWAGICCSKHPSE